LQSSERPTAPVPGRKKRTEGAGLTTEKQHHASPMRKRERKDWRRLWLANPSFRPDKKAARGEDKNEPIEGEKRPDRLLRNSTTGGGGG